MKPPVAGDVLGLQHVVADFEEGAVADLDVAGEIDLARVVEQMDRVEGLADPTVLDGHPASDAVAAEEIAIEQAPVVLNVDPRIVRRRAVDAVPGNRRPDPMGDRVL